MEKRCKYYYHIWKGLTYNLAYDENVRLMVRINTPKVSRRSLKSVNQSPPNVSLLYFYLRHSVHMKGKLKQSNLK